MSDDGSGHGRAGLEPGTPTAGIARPCVTHPTEAERDGRPVYRDANVLRWLGAYTASVTGDVAYYFVLTWAASRVAGAAQVGLVLAVGAAPRAVLMLGGGVLADRFGPRRVLIASDAVRSAMVAAVALVTWIAGPGLWSLCLLALAFGIVDAVFMPAVGALPPRIAPVAQLARVQALRGLAVRLGNAVGPLIAAAVVAVGGAAAGFAVAGVLFVVSLVLIVLVRIAPLAPSPAGGPSGRDRPATTFRDDLREGWQLLRGDRRLARLVTVLALGEMCFSGPLAAGLVLFTQDRGWGPAELGGLLAAFSIGGAATGLVLATVSRVPRAPAVMATALLLCGLAVAALGRTQTTSTALLCCGLVGAASGTAGTLAHTLVQRATEPRYLGRITSVTTLCTLGLAPALYPLAGVVTARWGTGAFFLGCGAVCIAAVALSLTAPVRRAEL
ncbi:MFS transporter [Streptomyces sp. NPDC059816]|uniref:MFS transporter n=1 Tax=Streptomyces sp. NPDC059816 TaxID=3346960 RepID=UPI003669F76C